MYESRSDEGPVGSFDILQKLRLTFAKKADLRFLSHHDVMRAFHRALRRADLPVRMTEGFNKRPRVVFPHALEVGIASEDEAVEIELSSWMQPTAFGRQLSTALPEGLAIRQVYLAPPRRQSSIAVEAHYVVALGDRDREKAETGVAAFMAAASWPVQRTHHKGGVKEVDLRPSVMGAELDGNRIALRLRLGQPGAAKPREVLAAMLELPADDVLGMRLVKTKTVLAAPA